MRGKHWRGTQRQRCDGRCGDVCKIRAEMGKPAGLPLRFGLVELDVSPGAVNRHGEHDPIVGLFKVAKYLLCDLNGFFKDGLILNHGKQGSVMSFRAAEDTSERRHQRQIIPFAAEPLAPQGFEDGDAGNADFAPRFEEVGTKFDLVNHKDE